MPEQKLGAKISTREMQLIENDILLEFKKFCEEKGLEYFLSGGTVLGAVRHKGFIPWDDDIDVYMKRKEYERFCALASEFDRSNQKGYIFSLPGESAKAFPYAKILDTSTIAFEPLIEKRLASGIWIDIFPLDNYYNDEKKNARYVKRNKRALKLVAFMKCDAASVGVESTHTGIKKFVLKIVITLLKILRVFLPTETIYRRVDARAKKMDAYEAQPKFVGDGVLPNSMKDHFDKRFFEHSVPVEFEGVMHPNPVGAHEYLTHLYGDYMQFPPPEKRKPHCTETYHLEKSE